MPGTLRRQELPLCCMMNSSSSVCWTGRVTAELSPQGQAPLVLLRVPEHWAPTLSAKAGAAGASPQQLAHRIAWGWEAPWPYEVPVSCLEGAACVHMCTCVSVGVNAPMLVSTRMSRHPCAHACLRVLAAVRAPADPGRGAGWEYSRGDLQAVSFFLLVRSGWGSHGLCHGPTRCWCGAGEGRAGGAHPAPWQAQLPARAAFILPAPSRETESAASQGRPPRVTGARHSLGIPKLPTGCSSLLAWLEWDPSPLPPSYVGACLHGSWLFLNGLPPHIPGGGEGAVHVSSSTKGSWLPSSAQCSHEVVGPPYL